MMTNRDLGKAARAALREIGFTKNDVAIKIVHGFGHRWIDAEIKNASISYDDIRSALESVIIDSDKSDTSVCVYNYGK